MKICVISTPIFPCPPSGYSGLEFLAWQQTVGLANKGHDVTLIAPQGSQVPDGVKLHATTLHESEKQAYSGYWQILPNSECVIDHSWQKWSNTLKMEGKLNAPILNWLHAPVNAMYQSPPPIDKPCLVCISEDQAKHTQEHLKCKTQTCYNGVDVDFYKPLNKKRNDRYLFLARFSHIKGPDIAVDVFKNCNLPLDMVGDDTITGEPELTRSIKENCALLPKLRYIGSQNRHECFLWFNANKALIHPIMRYREPFGLAPVEAQLCGMPVIAWNNGAMSETIKHGETGFLVNSQQEMEDIIASNAVDDIKHENCREWASQFSYNNMINRVEQLCNMAVETGGW